MTIQTALVGMGHIHTPAVIKRLQARSDVTVRYVWDHDAERAQRSAAELGAQVANLETIWADREVQAAAIFSETNRHTSLVLAGAAAGKHLFVEKPLGMGAQDAGQMAAAIEQAGILFQTGYFHRGNPVYRFIKDQLAAGAFGKVTRLRVSNCHAGSLRGWFDSEWAWMADLKQSGVGAFGDLGTHALDIMLWLLGDVTQVTANLGVATGRYGDTDEYGEGLLKFASGATGSLAAGWVDVANPVTLVLSGTQGHAHMVNGELFLQSELISGADGKAPWIDLPKALPHSFELFLDAVGGKPGLPLVGAREAAYRSAVMEALYRGAKEAAWVNA